MLNVEQTQEKMKGKIGMQEKGIKTGMERDEAQ